MQKLPIEHATTHLRLLGMAVLWGGSWPGVRYLVQLLPPASISAWRFLLATTALLGWVWWRHGHFPRTTARQGLWLVAAGLVGVFGYAILFMYGLKMVPASRAALVVTINPVFTTLLAAWLFRERFNWKIGAGMATAVLGAMIVMSHGAPWKLLAGELSLGDWLLLGCMMAWVVYSLIGRATLTGLDPVAATAYAALVGMPLLWVAAYAIDGSAAIMQTLVSLDGVGWFAMLFLSLGATVLAYAWFFEGIAKLGAGAASSYISLVPVFGVTSSVLLLGEAVDASLMVGGVMAIVGVTVMNQARR